MFDEVENKFLSGFLGLVLMGVVFFPPKIVSTERLMVWMSLSGLRAEVHTIEVRQWGSLAEYIADFDSESYLELLKAV